MTFVNMGSFYAVGNSQKFAYQNEHSSADIVKYADNQEGIVVFNDDGSVTAASSVKDDKPAGEIHTYLRDGNEWKEKLPDGTLSAFKNGEVISAHVENDQLKFSYAKAKDDDATKLKIISGSPNINTDVTVGRSSNGMYGATVHTDATQYNGMASGNPSSANHVTDTYITYDPNAQGPTKFKMDAKNKDTATLDPATVKSMQEQVDSAAKAAGDGESQPSSKVSNVITSESTETLKPYEGEGIKGWFGERTNDVATWWHNL